MSEPFIGEIRMVGFNFAPAGWAACHGQLIPISENEALFSLIGTTYGGDGQQTFALPDLQGRLPVHQGTLAGGGTYTIGQAAGVETVTLTINQTPAHAHAAAGQSSTGDQTSPAGNVFAASSLNAFTASAPNTQLNAAIGGSSGGNQPHDNFMPYLVVNFVIALFGVFPSRN